METITYQERDLLRRFAFHRFDCWHADTLARIEARSALLTHTVTNSDATNLTPAGARGRTIVRSADEYSADELVTLRASAALRSAQIGSSVSPASKRVQACRSALVSPERFLRWLNSYRPAQHVASDAAMATVDEQLADLDSYRSGLFVLTPVMATSDWSYLSHLSPGLPTQHRPLPDQTHQTRYCTCADCRDAAFDQLPTLQRRSWSRPLPTHLLPVPMVETTANDPGKFNRQAWSLERATRMFFAEHGEQHPTMDRLDKTRGRFHSKPDRVAFRGVARFRRPAPCRYESTVTDKTVSTSDGTLELATRLTRLYWCHCSQSREACQCDRTGWKGHRRVTFPRPIKFQARAAQSKATQTKRADDGATSKRGRNVTAWTASDRSLARIVARLSTSTPTFPIMVAEVEQALRSLTEAQTIAFDTGVIVTMLAGESTVTDSHRGSAYPVRQWARRYAIEQHT